MAGLVLIVAVGAFAATQLRGGNGDDAAENQTLSSELASPVHLGFDPSQNQISSKLATPVHLGFDPSQNLVSSEPITLAPPATPEQSEMVAEAIARFDDAGMELPALQIEFVDDDDGCQGHAGVFVAAPWNPESFVDRITICHDHRLILLHEMAHAWIRHNVEDDTRAAFVEHWGLTSWSNSSDPYADRGIERAAQTIAFTLNQNEATKSEAVRRYICDFELLTGFTLEIHTKVDC
jgi:hypothetical protein